MGPSASPLQLDIFGSVRMSYYHRGFNGGRSDPDLGLRDPASNLAQYVNPRYPCHWRTTKIKRASDFALLTGVWNWDAHLTGYNAAYADGSARWIKDPDENWDTSSVWWSDRPAFGEGGIIENTPNASVYRKATWEYIDKGAGGGDRY